MKERKVVRQFALNTEIYDAELPQKIHDAIANDLPAIASGIYYSMEMVFDKSVYAVKAFYHYQLDKEPVSPPQGRHKETDSEKQKRLLTAILNQQLEKSTKQVESFGFDIDGSAIIGDNTVNLHSVEFTLYESKEKNYTKKGRPETHYKAFNIMPDRPFILDQAAKMFAQMFQEHMKEEANKQFELSQHTPNLTEAGEIFKAVSCAILSGEQIGSSVEAEKLSGKLRSQAVMESDWPLKIVAGTKAEAETNPIDAAFQIDCPEYLLYHAYQGGHWELEKVSNLKAAQAIITKSGYNLKKTANIIVLHNLQPVPFTLFEETEEGLVRISKEEAIGKKKLMLSWEK